MAFIKTYEDVYGNTVSYAKVTRLIWEEFYQSGALTYTQPLMEDPENPGEFIPDPEGEPIPVINGDLRTNNLMVDLSIWKDREACNTNKAPVEVRTYSLTGIDNPLSAEALDGAYPGFVASVYAKIKEKDAIFSDALEIDLN